MSLESLFLPDFNVFFHSPDHLEGKDSLAAVIARFQDPICANVRSHLTALTSLSRAQEGTSGGLTAVVKGDDAGDSPGWAPASRAVSEYGGESATSYASCRSQVSQARSVAKTTPVYKPLVYNPRFIDEYNGECEVFKDPSEARYSKDPISWLRRFGHLCRTVGSGATSAGTVPVSNRRTQRLSSCTTLNMASLTRRKKWPLTRTCWRDSRTCLLSLTRQKTAAPPVSECCAGG